jgi:hypothetical protein
MELNRTSVKYEIETDSESIGIPKTIQDKIIKDYLMSRYQWTIGLSMFIIGLFVGVLIS